MTEHAPWLRTRYRWLSLHVFRTYTERGSRWFDFFGGRLILFRYHNGGGQITVHLAGLHFVKWVGKTTPARFTNSHEGEGE